MSQLLPYDSFSIQTANPWGIKEQREKQREIFASWDLHKSRSKYMAKVTAIFGRIFNQPGLVFPLMESRLWKVYCQGQVRTLEAGLFPGNLAACTPWPEAQDLDEAGNLRHSRAWCYLSWVGLGRTAGSGAEEMSWAVSRSVDLFSSRVPTLLSLARGEADHFSMLPRIVQTFWPLARGSARSQVSVWQMQQENVWTDNHQDPEPTHLLTPVDSSELCQSPPAT